MWIVKLSATEYASELAPTNTRDAAEQHAHAVEANTERVRWLGDYPDAIVVWVEK